MKWILTSKQQDAVHVFHLMEANSIKEILRYHPAQQSARISSQGSQRLFFIEQAGFRSNHFVFKNEYGFDMGKFSFDHRNNSGGIIEIEGRKIHYALLNNPQPELVIYMENSLHPMVTCNLKQAGDSKDAATLNQKETIHEYACLLLGLCWYLFKPVNSEVGVDTYDTSLALA